MSGWAQYTQNNNDWWKVPNTTSPWMTNTGTTNSPAKPVTPTPAPAAKPGSAEYTAQTVALQAANAQRAKDIVALAETQRSNRDSELTLQDRRNQGYKKANRSASVQQNKAGAGNISAMSTNQAAVYRINVGKSTGG